MATSYCAKCERGIRDSEGEKLKSYVCNVCRLTYCSFCIDNHDCKRPTNERK